VDEHCLQALGARQPARVLKTREQQLHSTRAQLRGRLPDHRQPRGKQVRPFEVVECDERDVVGVRSNFRGEDVQLYRLNASPDAARRLLLEYVSDANELVVQPQFYNSLTTNCTTTAVKMMRAVGASISFDWRLIVNGYLPDYAYARGALDTRVSLPALKESAHIDARARLADGSPRFSQLIRVDVPSPRDMASAILTELE